MTASTSSGAAQSAPSPILPAATMTADEARAHVTSINDAVQDIGRRLLDLREREGWKALNYPSWTQFLQGEFDYSRKYLYELMRAAPVQEQLLPIGYKISNATAAALAAYAPEIRPMIAMTASARYGGKLTESNVKRIGEIVQEMAITGHADTGSGTGTAVDAAMDKADNEAKARADQYRADRANSERIVSVDARVDSTYKYDGLYVTFDVDEATMVLLGEREGETVRLVVYAPKK